MTYFHEVKLELVRPGPPHNQLLSPLTSYMALCGEGSPITFHIELEHQQLLSRLERLRYVTAEGLSGVAVADRVREATVAEVGEDVAQIFGELRSLLGEEWRAVGDAGAGEDSSHPHLIHLRLVLSGSELSLLPFEMAIAPQATPGEGLEWALQFHMPIVLTREIRRTRPVPIPWDRPIEPRVLLVSAAPIGLGVPLQQHVLALRTALEPWIRWPKSGSKDERIPLVKERLRVLPNASIESIYEECSKEQFTHIHILAHGDYVEVGGERRFGLALCKHDNNGIKEVVSGKRLAKALQAESKDGSRRSQPLVVTLSTCDSGNPGTVLVPGGSLAHDLHTAGVPWVFASQFPLTKAGSVRMTDALYPRLLRGDDPRQVIYEVRRQLYMSAERDHDWASMVIYSAVPTDFDDQVMSFFERQMRLAINVSLERADNAAATKTENERALNKEMEHALNITLGYLELWENRLPQGDDIKSRLRRGECYGMRGSTFKRIGLLHYSNNDVEMGKIYLEQSLAAYHKATEEWVTDHERIYHWVATQALSLAAVLKQPPEPDIYMLAHKLAERDLASRSDSLKAWAHASLAELEMLAMYHDPKRSAKGRKLEQKVYQHCHAIVNLMGESSFEVRSTRRQFKRYIDDWDDKELWRPFAEKAVNALSPVGDASPSQFPLY